MSDKDEMKSPSDDVPIEILLNRLEELAQAVTEGSKIIITLQESAELGVKLLRYWVENNECECEGSIHSCGLTERKLEVDNLVKLLNLHSATN